VVPRTSKLYVKSGGLTAGVPSGQYAFLASTPQADPASPGGQITKTGDGTLALYNAEMPVQVNAGTLRLMGAHISTNKLAKTISVAAGASLELAAPHAARQTRSHGTAASTGNSDWRRAELWKVHSAAIARTDGALEQGPGRGSARRLGLITRRSREQRVDRLFALAQWPPRLRYQATACVRDPERLAGRAPTAPIL
jgi:hypothetical protein